MFERESHQLRLLPHRDSSRSGRYRDGLKADHLPQHSASRVGSGDQDSAESEALRGDRLQASKESVR